MQAAPKNSLKLSVVIPAYNEKMNIIPTLKALVGPLRDEGIPFEIVVVNDNCTDETPDLVLAEQKVSPEIVLVNRRPPGGFGRAVRDGFARASGEVIMLVMADLSDDPRDMVACYRKMEEGYDCVFGSRFMPGGRVTDYPPLKFLINRLVNRLLQVLFLTRHDDLTNAFKVYRRHVIQAIAPLYACHFNITIELSLSALIRRFKIARLPISWYGRTWGQSNLKLRQMGRRYLATLLKIWFERMLILDDVLQGKTEPEEN